MHDASCSVLILIDYDCPFLAGLADYTVAEGDDAEARGLQLARDIAQVML